MKLILISVLTFILVGCAETSRYENVPGHPYMTDKSCKRTQPLGKFDERCDCPRKGYPNSCPFIPGINS